MQGGFRPGLEPVNHSGVDGGQEALTAHAEVGSYWTGCEHHVQVVAHLQDTSSSYDAQADAEHALPAGNISPISQSAAQTLHMWLSIWLAHA